VSRICKYECILRSIDDKEESIFEGRIQWYIKLMSDESRSRLVEVILETIGEIAATSHILSSSVSRQTHVYPQ
jgi:hypothetical protein